MSPVAGALERVVDDLAGDVELPRDATTWRRRGLSLAGTAEQLKLLAAVPLERQSQRIEFETFAESLSPAALEIFQVNVGKLCNMTCRHCHVDAGPDRKDAVMPDA